MKLILLLIPFSILGSQAVAAQGRTPATQDSEKESSQGLVDLRSPILRSIGTRRILPIQAGKSWSARGQLELGLTKMYGLSAGIAHHWDFLAVDLRAGYSLTSYGQIIGIPGPRQFSEYSSITPEPTMTSESGSEFNRYRKATDSWSVLSLEAGVGTQGRLFVSWFPKVSQGVRFALIRPYLTDSLNSLKFSGWLVKLEPSLQYAFSETNPFSLELSLAMTFGNVSRTDVVTRQTSQLPLQYWTTGISLVRWF